NLKSAALAVFAFHANCATKAPDDSVNHRKSETAAGSLGAEERVKDPGLDFRRHAATGIRDLQLNVIALGQIFRCRTVVVRSQSYATRGDANLPVTVLDRVGSIHYQVHHNLAEL